jgi:hypothetical protein
METLGDLKKLEKTGKYICEKCHFNTCDKNDYNRHLLTQKHHHRVIANELETEKLQKTELFVCNNCHKEYKSRNGLWKHNKICIKLNDTKPDNTQELSEMFQSFMKHNTEMQNLVIEAVKTNNTTNNINSNNNSNNKTFNLNLFLNETCKDAMNLTEFMDSIQIEYDDFERLGEIGFVNGISNIIIKNLKDLDITQRAIHCTDKKREILYVKEDNKWEKEDNKFEKIRKLIKKTADKNMCLLPKFKEKYPDCYMYDSIYSDKHDILLIETMGGSGDNDYEKATQILKKIAKEIVIDKNI